MNLNQEKKNSLRNLVKNISDRDSCIEVSGLSGTDTAYMAARIYVEHHIPILLVAPSTKAAKNLLADLRFFLNGRLVTYLNFPSYNILPFKFLSYHNEIAAKRIRTLYRMITADSPPIIVTTADGLMQKIIPRKEIIEYAELVMSGEEVERDRLIEKLIAGGYVRTVITEEPGDFSVRGGILDIFSPMYNDPLRIEFFGDDIEEIRFFSASNQRKLNTVQEAIILPAREAVLRKESLSEIINSIKEQASKLSTPVTKVRGIVDRIKHEGVLKGVESLLALIYPDPDTLFDYLPDSSLIVASGIDEIERNAYKTENKVREHFNSARNEGLLCVEPDRLYLSWPETKKSLNDSKSLTVKMLPVMKTGEDRAHASVQFNFNIKDNAEIKSALKEPRSRDALLSPLVDWISENRDLGLFTLLICRNKARFERLYSLLLPYGIQLTELGGFPDLKKHSKGLVYACLGRISAGFIWQDESLAVISDDEIFGVKARSKIRRNQKPRTDLIAFEDLKSGDLIVHDEHGIGEYSGLVKLELNGATNDFLLIVYRGGDRLYLPVDHMSVIQKYMGMDGISPVLDKMGGKTWDRVKAKVKKSAEKIAGELLRVYAARKVEKGFSFQEFDHFFKDFEAGFPYEETADQLKAIDDVQNDMAKSVPMDRLVCGDVGYGKTEVALRASFLAVNNNKQVVVLVPTTVLAEQHFTTFSERFKHYPVNVECLSRFRPLPEQRRIVQDLKSGRADIVIGTHRLLSKDIGVKDLGLIVIDEEQRFGVKHKEKLKNLRKTVDVLALTATPIPRTLHMSMMGIHDISVISTPPEYRQAIVTYISEFDDLIVAEAIRKELSRKGQIFFIHNNIKSIGRIAKKLGGLVPEARLEIAHGRMNEKELERVMLHFINRDIDMLVCTTIVESGLDIPSANTIMVNRADRFGLAQMYQLRGRVGRSDEQAYAYLFIPHESILSQDAQKRLKVLMEHSDLGAGFQIAMSDLKIRGGGTILGASQSGHIAAVGYDMFLKLMENAVSELKGEPVRENLEPEVNMKLSAFVPESYIRDIDQRLSAYRTLAKMTSLKEINDYKEEMSDRYGALPEETTNLLLKIMLKVLAIRAGVKRVDMTGRRLQLYFSETHQNNPLGLVDMAVEKPDRFEFTPDHTLKVKLKGYGSGGLVAKTKNILKEIAHRVNS